MRAKVLIKGFLVAFGASAAILAGCGGGGSAAATAAMPSVSQVSGMIVLSPMGTVNKPVIHYVGGSNTFTITASEVGYTGTFTARNVTPGMTPETCWVAAGPSSSAGVLTFVPGTVCPAPPAGQPGFSEQIKVSDSLGNSTTTYIYGLFLPQFIP